jgi:hypothetical protein
MKFITYKDKIFQLTKVDKESKIIRHYKQQRNLDIQKTLYIECRK